MPSGHNQLFDFSEKKGSLLQCCFKVFPYVKTTHKALLFRYLEQSNVVSGFIFKAFCRTSLVIRIVIRAVGRFLKITNKINFVPECRLLDHG
jgi:hypothetical protein